MIRIEHDVEALGLRRLLRISNDEVEVLTSAEFGIRILGYRRRGGANVLGMSEAAHPTGYGRPWRPRGGHRLWAAPEHPIKTYWPDDAPPEIEVTRSGVRLRQAVEPPSGIEKTIEIELAERGSRVTLRHRLSNRTRTITVAPWALTILRAGGQAILPNAPFVPHPTGLLPARALVLWPYTNLGDPRFRFGPDVTRIRHDPAIPSPQKIGSRADEGWLGYASDGELFVKRYRPADGPHADLGCNVEIFVDGGILELETLGPLASLAPGSSVDHLEHWYLFGEVELPEDDLQAAPLLSHLLATTSLP